MINHTCVLSKCCFWSCASVEANKWSILVWVCFWKNIFSVCRIYIVFIVFLLCTTFCMCFLKSFKVLLMFGFSLRDHMFSCLDTIFQEVHYLLKNLKRFVSQYVVWIKNFERNWNFRISIIGLFKIREIQILAKKNKNLKLLINSYFDLCILD